MKTRKEIDEFNRIVEKILMFTYGFGRSADKMHFSKGDIVFTLDTDVSEVYTLYCKRNGYKHNYHEFSCSDIKLFIYNTIQ